MSSRVVHIEFNDRLFVTRQYTSVRYNRKENAASDFEILLPRDLEIPISYEFDSNRLALQDGSYLLLQDDTPLLNVATVDTQSIVAQLGYLNPVRIYQGGELEFSGYITERGLEGDVLRVVGMSEEILLSRHLVPTQMSYPLQVEYPDLADFSRNLLEGWHTLRVKDQAQWASRIVSSTNIDTSVQPGLLMLSRVTTEPVEYQGSGTFRVRFDSQEVPNFTRWDRIRWLSDFDFLEPEDEEDPNISGVSTYVRYRQATTIAGLSSATWTAWVAGALTDTVGVLITNPTARYLEVEGQLRPTEPEREFTPVFYALEVLTRTDVGLEEGNIPASTGVTVRPFDGDEGNVLGILSDVFTVAGWQFRVVDRKLDVAESFGTDKTQDFTLTVG